MTASQEVLAMRATIWAALTPAEIRTINFAALANAAADALARGWTGEQIGKAAVENLGRVDNLGAVMVTAIRQLGQTDPPRPVTPTAPPYAQVRAAMYPPGHTPAADPAAWAARIRDQLRHRDDDEGAA